MNPFKRKKQRIIDYQTTFKSESGQRVLKDLMRSHYFLTPTFSPDSNITVLREGERNVVLKILTVLDMDPETIMETARKEEDYDYA